MGIVGGLWLAIVQWLTPDTLRWTLPARVVLLTVGAAALLFLCLALLYLRVWIRSRTKVRYAGPLERRQTTHLCPVSWSTLR
jgi:hypothetical protein